MKICYYLFCVAGVLLFTPVIHSETELGKLPLTTKMDTSSEVTKKISDASLKINGTNTLNKINAGVGITFDPGKFNKDDVENVYVIPPLSDSGSDYLYTKISDTPLEGNRKPLYHYNDDRFADYDGTVYIDSTNCMWKDESTLQFWDEQGNPIPNPYGWVRLSGPESVHEIDKIPPTINVDTTTIATKASVSALSDRIDIDDANIYIRDYDRLSRNVLEQGNIILGANSVYTDYLDRPIVEKNHIIGYQNTFAGNEHVVVGHNNLLTGTNCNVIGLDNNVSATKGNVIGSDNQLVYEMGGVRKPTIKTTMIGSDNNFTKLTNTAERSFIIGNGSTSGDTLGLYNSFILGNAITLTNDLYNKFFIGYQPSDIIMYGDDQKEQTSLADYVSSATTLTASKLKPALTNSTISLVAVGNNAKAFVRSSVAIGDRAYARGLYSVALGANSCVTNTVILRNGGIAIGGSAMASNAFATAIGYRATATDSNSTVIAVGNNPAISHGDNTFTVGLPSTNQLDHFYLGDNSLADLIDDTKTPLKINNTAITNSEIILGNGLEFIGENPLAQFDHKYQIELTDSDEPSFIAYAKNSDVEVNEGGGRPLYQENGQRLIHNDFYLCHYELSGIGYIDTNTLQTSSGSGATFTELPFNNKQNAISLSDTVALKSDIESVKSNIESVKSEIPKLSTDFGYVNPKLDDYYNIEFNVGRFNFPGDSSSAVNCLELKANKDYTVLSLNGGDVGGGLIINGGPLHGSSIKLSPSTDSRNEITNEFVTINAGSWIDDGVEVNRSAEITIGDLKVRESITNIVDRLTGVETNSSNASLPNDISLPGGSISITRAPNSKYYNQGIKAYFDESTARSTISLIGPSYDSIYSHGIKLESCTYDDGSGLVDNIGGIITVEGNTGENAGGRIYVKAGADNPIMGAGQIQVEGKYIGSSDIPPNITITGGYWADVNVYPEITIGEVKVRETINNLLIKIQQLETTISNLTEQVNSK